MEAMFENCVVGDSFIRVRQFLGGGTVADVGYCACVQMVTQWLLCHAKAMTCETLLCS